MTTTTGTPLEVAGVTKRFGEILAVDGLSFRVEPGRVTGFLGPNGAGKTTTLRMLLGLVEPTSGTATVGGHRYVDLPQPGRVVGAALEATGVHPTRTGRTHLRVLAAENGFAAESVSRALDLVGLGPAADRGVGGYSLGMKQRLSLAAAMLGDPAVLVLDEPANGLDPEGVAWLRGFLRYLAEQGRTILVSSHVLSEVEQTVDDVVIIARGRLVRQAPLAELTTGSNAVVVRTPDAARLASALQAGGAAVRQVSGDELEVTGPDTAHVGRLALQHAVELHELRRATTDLEQVFLELTGGAA